MLPVVSTQSCLISGGQLVRTCCHMCTIRIIMCTNMFLWCCQFFQRNPASYPVVKCAVDICSGVQVRVIGLQKYLCWKFPRHHNYFDRIFLPAQVCLRHYDSLCWNSMVCGGRPLQWGQWLAALQGHNWAPLWTAGWSIQFLAPK